MKQLLAATLLVAVFCVTGCSEKKPATKPGTPATPATPDKSKEAPKAP